MVELSAVGQSQLHSELKRIHGVSGQNTASPAPILRTMYSRSLFLISFIVDSSRIESLLYLDWGSLINQPFIKPHGKVHDSLIHMD